jgi:hypothetical protein
MPMRILRASSVDVAVANILPRPPMRVATQRRLHRLAERRLEDGEQIVASAAVWYSRPVRLAWLAARHRDLAVLTDRRLMLWECGWLTRRPRRRVLADALADLTATDLGVAAGGEKGRRLRLDHTEHPPIVLELGDSRPARAIARTLLEHAVPDGARDGIDLQL